MNSTCPPEYPSELEVAPNPFCCWIIGLGERLCMKPATHREPMSNWTYCEEHALDVAEMFGYDQIDLIANEGPGNVNPQSRTGESPIKDIRPLTHQERQREMALKCFRIVKGKGDAGSEGAFNCLQLPEASGWLRLATRMMQAHTTDWTESPPNEDSWWWMLKMGELQVVRVKYENGQFYIMAYTQQLLNVKNIDALWAGPIPHPREP